MLTRDMRSKKLRRITHSIKYSNFDGMDTIFVYYSPAGFSRAKISFEYTLPDIGGAAPPT